jgi:hypothetical protein
MSNENPFEGFELIHAYTRAQAVADGVLVELRLAKRYGFKVPVAITSAAFTACIDWNLMDPEAQTMVAQRETAVLMTALRTAQAGVKAHREGTGPEPGNRIDFVVDCLANDGSASTRQVPLYMLIGPGDNAEPVGTIMLPDED